jgi:uncharacterized protein (TIGR03067 family)
MMTSDLELLQGDWSVTSLEIDGEPVPSAVAAAAHISIRGDRFTTGGMGAVYEGRLELNASTTPRRLDMKFESGPEAGNTNFGIYELNGDTWIICLATRGSTRPSSFATTGGSGLALEVLRRGRPVGSEPPARSPVTARSADGAGAVTEFGGEWPLVSAVMDGQPMEQSLVQWVKRVTEGNRTTVMAGPRVMLQVEFSTDPGAAPPAIDYRILAGSNKGKTQLGIYRFEDGLLWFCVAAPGDARPRAFESLPGDSRALTVWKRP